MKIAFTTAALVLASSLATAGDFAYERQWASEDLASEVSSLVFRATDPAPSMGNTVISLHESYRGNPDTEVLPEGFRQQYPGSSRTYCTTGYDRIAQGNPDLSTIC